MGIKKAVLTAAGRGQRTLPMQTLFDQQGIERSVLSLIVREAVRAAIRLTFVQQTEPRGYAHAVWCARDFVKDEPFLHLVGDHIYVSKENAGCAERLVEAA